MKRSKNRTPYPSITQCLAVIFTFSKTQTCFIQFFTPFGGREAILIPKYSLFLLFSALQSFFCCVCTLNAISLRFLNFPQNLSQNAHVTQKHFLETFSCFYLKNTGIWLSHNHCRSRISKRTVSIRIGTFPNGRVKEIHPRPSFFIH